MGNSIMTKSAVMLYKNMVNFQDDYQNNLSAAMTVQHMLMNYGYMLDDKAFDMLKKADLSKIVEFKTDCETILSEFLGSGFTSLYNNFPNDVLSLDRAEFYFNQIMHYWGVKSFPTVGAPKEEAFEWVDYKTIRGVDVDSIINVYKNLASSPVALNPMDLAVLKYFATANIELPYVNVGFKENLAVLVSLLPNFKTETVVDVLRIACVLGKVEGGAQLLPVPKPKKSTGGYKMFGSKTDATVERNKFRFNLSESDKLRLLDLFETSNLSLADLNQGRRYARFIRLFEILKPTSAHPKTFGAVQHLRNQARGIGKKKTFEAKPKIRTWYYAVEYAFSQGFAQGVLKLKERPGEFLRRIDWMVRTATKNESHFLVVLDALSQIMPKTKNKTIFEVYTHFEKRKDPVINRSIFIKGARKKTALPNLPAIAEDKINAILETLLEGFKDKLKLLPAMEGKYVIDDKLKQMPLPTNMGSMSESFNVVVRGQRIQLPNKSFLRAYAHWHDLNGNEDIDLHGTVYSEDFKKSTGFGWNSNYKTSIGTYSGDIIRRRGRNAEYNDINFEAAVNQGYRYYVQRLHNFTGRPFESMHEFSCGICIIDKPESTMTWVPTTVEFSFLLKSKVAYAISCVIDLVTKELIVMDLDLDYGGNMRPEEIMPYLYDPKLSVYDLLQWHIIARGGYIVDSSDSEAKRFTVEEFKNYTAVLPFMVD